MKGTELLNRWIFEPHISYEVLPNRMSKREIIDLLKVPTEGIWRYDEHLFRIRSWWMAVSALLIVGFIYDERAMPIASLGLSQKPPQFAFFVVSVVGIGFWALDAMNKSLQLVLIHMGRDLEQSILFDIPVWAPSKSRRYKMRDGRHLWNIVKNLSEQSVAPFYLLPILGSGLIFYTDHLSNISDESLKFPEIWSAEALAIWTGVSLVLLFAWSLYLRLRWDFGNALLKKISFKARKRFIIEKLKLQGVLEEDCFCRVRGFQYYMLGGNDVLFIDYPKTWKDESYIAERHLISRHFGLRPFALNVSTFEIFDCMDGRSATSKDYGELVAQLQNRKEWSGVATS